MATAMNGLPAKPVATPVMPANIPDDLIGRKQWLVWRWQRKPNGDWTKPPYSPHSRSKADVTIARNYGSFDEALTTQAQMRADGIGFALIAGGDLTFIDLDHCRDVDTGEIADWATSIIRRFPASYVEISPSQTGLHVIVKGSLPDAQGTKRPITVPGADPKAAIEMYSGGRYATITGNVIDDGHRAPGDAQDAITTLFRQIKPPEQPTPPRLHVVSDLPIDIEERLDVARRASNGSAFSALFDHGDISGNQNDRSAADLALCSHLGFYLDYQSDQIDTAFRQSALMRSKWDERHRHDGATYGRMTIEKVLATRGEAYSPGVRVNPVLPTTTTNGRHEDSFIGTDDVPMNEIEDRFVTAAELCAMVPEEPEWIARPYVVVGGVTELTGQIKSGKSTLLGYLVKRLVDGGEFLGAPTSAGPVIYLTEQTPTTFREILERSDLALSNDLHILTWHDVRVDKWPLVVAAAVAKAHREGARVLIVDTLPQFAGLRGDTENNSGDALKAILPVQAAAQDDLAVIVVRHDRKSGGEVGASSRGSSAFGGAVDIILQLKKAEGNARPTLRILSALSRFDDTPAEITIERQPDGTFTALEPEQAYEKSRIRAAVLDMAPRSEDDAMTVDEFTTDLAGAKRTSVNDVLKRLVADGIMQKTGNGTRGNPYVFWIVNEPEDVSEMEHSGPKTPPSADSSDRSIRPINPESELPGQPVGVSFGGSSPLRSRGGTDERNPRPVLPTPINSSVIHRKPVSDVGRLLDEN